jgi:hypothetical protein
MRPGMRFGLSAIEKRDVWKRWKLGQTLHEIGRAYDKPHTSIRAVLLPRGGIPPIAHRRTLLALALAEREDISRGIASGSSIREIARCLGRAASTVSREVARHGGRPAYRAHDADRTCQRSAAVIMIMAARPVASLQSLTVCVGRHHVAQRKAIATMTTRDVGRNSFRFLQAIAAPFDRYDGRRHVIVELQTILLKAHGRQYELHQDEKECV